MTATFDTSAWIEFFSGTDAGSVFAEVVRGYGIMYAPTITLMELKNKYVREGKPWKERVAYIRRRSILVDLDVDLALIAAEMKHKHRLHTVDAIVYAVAESTDSKLYTTDAHFKGLPRTVLPGKR